MNAHRAIALYREQRINDLLRPYANAIAKGFQQAVRELEAFDAARDAEHRAHMELESRVTRTERGVSFELHPGDTDELLWAAKRVLHNDPHYDPNGGVKHEQPRGGASNRWIVNGYWRMG